MRRLNFSGFASMKKDMSSTSLFAARNNTMTFVWIATLTLMLRAAAAQTSSPANKKCWSNFTLLYFDLERQATNSTNHTYVICPNQTYNIGYNFGQGECCENGDLPIVTRSNTHFKCGDDGSSRNNCVIYGGSSSVLFNSVIWDEDIYGATIQGFTFQSPVLTTLFGLASGDVTFIDCIIKVSHLTCSEPHQFDWSLRFDSHSHTPPQRTNKISGQLSP